MSTKKVWVLLIILAVGVTAIATAGFQTIHRNQLAWVATGTFVTAVAAGVLVTLLKHRIHPAGSRKQGTTTLPAVGALVGIIAAMLIPNGIGTPFVMGP